MRQRIGSAWYELQDSLWFIPAVMTIGGILLALLMLQIDHLLVDHEIASHWLFGGGAEGARGVLTAIASTTITVTATVFSITIVALQLASSQFTPRVLRTFTGDRGNQLVLGVFIATFTYSLLVLRAVRSEADDRQRFVPSASVTVAIVLAIVAIGFLIYYIHHAARSIQASVVIDRAAQDTLRLIDRFFPEQVGEPVPHPAGPALPPAGPPIVVTSERGGYLQRLAADSLFALAEEGKLTVRVDRQIGDYVLPGAPIAAVWIDFDHDDPPDDEDLDGVADQVRDAFLFGPERTLAEDPGHGFHQLADIATRALSPGMNDPATAMNCIDRLTEALVILARRHPPADVRTADDGRVRLLVTPQTFEQLVAVSFTHIRHYGADDPVVSAHLATALGEAAAIIPLDRREPLAREVRLLLEEAGQAMTVRADRERLQEAGAWALAVTSTPEPAIG